MIVTRIGKARNDTDLTRNVKRTAYSHLLLILRCTYPPSAPVAVDELSFHRPWLGLLPIVRKFRGSISLPTNIAMDPHRTEYKDKNKPLSQDSDCVVKAPNTSGITELY